MQWYLERSTLTTQSCCKAPRLLQTTTTAPLGKALGCQYLFLLFNRCSVLQQGGMQVKHSLRRRGVGWHVVIFEVL